MGGIEEFELKGRDVVNAQLFYYRTEGKTKRFVRLELRDGRVLIIDRKYLPQLFRYLDVKQDVLLKLDYDERDREFLKALHRCTTKLMVSYLPESNRVVRVVSSDFTAIPHSVVLRAVRQVLKGNYETEDIETNGGMFAKWTLRSLPSECVKLGDIVSWQFWVYNRNDGKTGLRMGGGFTVLICNNGAIRWKNARMVRIIHRGDFDDIVNKLHENIDRIVNQELPTLAYLIENAQKVRLDKEWLEKYIKQYPQWIQKHLRRELRTAWTLWEASNAFSWVATHCPVTFNQRIKLANHAVELLKLAEVR